MTPVETAIERFRDAAMMPALWPQALNGFSELCRSDGATLVFKSTTLNSIAVSTSIRPFVPQYMSGQFRDSREHRVKPRLDENFRPDSADFSAREIATDPYYQEFMKPRGFFWNAVAALNGDLLISVKRAFERGPYEGADLQSLDELLPWLRATSRAASLTWKSNFDGQLSAFERLHRGALLLDSRGRLLRTNACVRFGDGLDVVDGTLHAQGGGARDRLRTFLTALFSHVNDPGTPAPASVALFRPSGARPWLLDGIACTDAIRSFHSEAAALVLITDLQLQPRPAAQSLRQLFGLTPIECSMVNALRSGKVLRAIAEELDISEGHARQRLKAIFRKTQTSRQAELIGLLAKLD